MRTYNIKAYYDDPDIAYIMTQVCGINIAEALAVFEDYLNDENMSIDKVTDIHFEGVYNVEDHLLYGDEYQKYNHNI